MQPSYQYDQGVDAHVGTNVSQEGPSRFPSEDHITGFRVTIIQQGGPYIGPCAIFVCRVGSESI